jgi:tRNA pseudouridine38-40 synthase
LDVERWYYAVLQYDGSRFCGWQRQPADRTVQAEFEAALGRIAGQTVAVTAAGRTDTGVHALGQVVSFSLTREWDALELERALNAQTPQDLWVVEAGRAPDGFHARKQAESRRYRYVIGCDPAARSPFRRPFEWALCRPLDLPRLHAAAQLIQGEHQFRSLSSHSQVKEHYLCTIRDAEWTERKRSRGFIFHIDANRFLHRMVRFLVGIMVDVALQKRPLEDIGRLLESEDNQGASPPAPPEGLYFVRAHYSHLKFRTQL